jgi:hypothetical protein
MNYNIFLHISWPILFLYKIISLLYILAIYMYVCTYMYIYAYMIYIETELAKKDV